jgi:hypothetical protein
MLLLFEAYGGGGTVDPPSGSSGGFGGFQVVPVAFFSILIFLLGQAVPRG